MFPGFLAAVNSAVPIVSHNSTGIIFDFFVTPSLSALLSRMPGNCSSNPSQFDCRNGTCISMSKFQDCVIDCPDGSDESR